MKNILSIITLLSIIALASCSKKTIPNTNEQGEAKQTPIEIAVAVSNSTTDFAFDFFKTLQTDPQATENVFVSPLSLHMALGMLANGATGETQTQILSAIKAGNLSIAELNASYKKLMTELPKADPKVKLALANSVWNKSGFIVEADYITTLNNYFEAQSKVLSTVEAINQWASDNTNGKITKVLQQLDPDLVLILMNALYFKGDWVTQFKTADTKNESFTLENGSSKTVSMMNQASKFKYASMDDFEAVELPYGNKQFVATIILPKPGKTLNAVFNNLNSTKWTSLQGGLDSATIILKLPKFKLEQDFQLNEVLKGMGMQKAFTDAAELQGIHKTAPLSVSFVKQNTFAAVDEVGTEAAAVTTIGIVFTSVGPITNIPFYCNRPFGIIISEKTSNTILFMGKIMNPDSH
ncbi:MAG: serpin family protein [Niabella sp.]